MTRASRIWILAVAFLGCGNATEPGAGSNSGSGSDNGNWPSIARVDVSQDFLTPEAVRVAVGGTVTWTNMDAVAHHLATSDATDASSMFDSDVIIGGSGFQPFSKFSVTFTRPGTVAYSCVLHTGTLRGTVLIGP